MAYPSWLPQTDKWLKKYQEALDQQYGEADIEQAFKPAIKQKFDEALGVGYNPADIAVEWQIDPAHYGYPPKSEAFSEEPPAPEAPEQGEPPKPLKVDESMGLPHAVESKLDFNFGTKQVLTRPPTFMEAAPEVTIPEVAAAPADVVKPTPAELAPEKKAPELTKLGLPEVAEPERPMPSIGEPAPQEEPKSADAKVVQHVAELRSEHTQDALDKILREEFKRYAEEGVRPERAQKLIENSLDNYIKKAAIQADHELELELLSDGRILDQAKANVGALAAALPIKVSKNVLPTITTADAFNLTTPDEIKDDPKSFYSRNKMVFTGKGLTETVRNMTTAYAAMAIFSPAAKAAGGVLGTAIQSAKNFGYWTGYNVAEQATDPDRKLDLPEAVTGGSLMGTLSFLAHLPGVGQKAILESATKTQRVLRAVGQDLTAGGLTAATNYVSAELQGKEKPTAEQLAADAGTIMLFHAISLSGTLKLAARWSSLKEADLIAREMQAAEALRNAANKAAGEGKWQEFKAFGSESLKKQAFIIQKHIDHFSSKDLLNAEEAQVFETLKSKRAGIEDALDAMDFVGEKPAPEGPAIEAPPPAAITGIPTRPALPPPGEAPPPAAEKPKVDPNLLDPAIVLRRMQEAEADPAQKEALENSIAALHNENLPDVLTTSGGQIVRKKLDRANIPYTRIRVDITNLTETNNRLGHTEADKYMKATINDVFARRIKEAGGVADRPGADEFGGYLPYHNEKEAAEITKSIEDEIAAIINKTELKNFTNPKRAGLKTGAMYINWGVQEKIPGHPGETERLADQKALLHYKTKLDKLADAAGMEWSAEAKNYVKKKAIPMPPPTPAEPFAEPLSTWPETLPAEAKAPFSIDEAMELTRLFEARLADKGLTPVQIEDVKRFTDQPVKGAEQKHQVFRMAEEIGRDLDPANPLEAGRKFINLRLAEIREQLARPWAIKGTEFARLEKNLRDKGPMFFRPWGESEKGKQLAEAWIKEYADTLAGVTTQEKLKARYQWKDKWAHRIIVEKALKENKPVPAEVLKEYPDLYEAHPAAKEIEKAARRQTIAGVHVDIQKPAGQDNLTQDINGKIVKSVLATDMGELPFTATADRPALRAFINPEPAPEAKIFVINQIRMSDPKKQLDRHIVMLGYDNPAKAIHAFTLNFPTKRVPYRGVYEFPSAEILQAWATAGRRDLPLDPAGYDPVRRPDFIPPQPTDFRITVEDLRAGGYPIENDPRYIKIGKDKIAEYKKRREDVLGWEKSKNKPDELNRIIFQSGRPLVNMIDDEKARKTLERIKAFAASWYGARTNQKIMILDPEVYAKARQEWNFDLQKWEVKDLVLGVIRRTDPWKLKSYADIRPHVSDAGLVKWAKEFFDMRPGEELEESLKIYDRPNNKYRKPSIDVDLPAALNEHLAGTEVIEGERPYGEGQPLDRLVSEALNFYFTEEYKTKPRLSDYIEAAAVNLARNPEQKAKALQDLENFQNGQVEGEEPPVEGQAANDALRDAEEGETKNLPSVNDIKKMTDEEIEKDRQIREAERRGDNFDVPPPPEEMGDGPTPRDEDLPFSLADKILPDRTPLTEDHVMQVFDSKFMRRYGLHHFSNKIKIIVAPGVPGHALPSNAEAAYIPVPPRNALIWINSAINPDRVVYLLGHELIGHYGIRMVLDENPNIKLRITHLFMNEWKYVAENGKAIVVEAKKKYGDKFKESPEFKALNDRASVFWTYNEMYKTWLKEMGREEADFLLMDEWIADHAGKHIEAKDRTGLGKRIWNWLVELFNKLMIRVGEKLGPGWAWARNRRGYIEETIKDCLKNLKKKGGRYDRVMDEKHLKSLYDEPIMEAAAYALKPAFGMAKPISEEKAKTITGVIIPDKGKKYEGIVFKSLREEADTYIQNASAQQDEFENKIKKLEASYDSEKRSKLIDQLGFAVKDMEGSLARLKEQGYSGNPEYAILQQAVMDHRKRMDALYERLARIPPAIEKGVKPQAELAPEVELDLFGKPIESEEKTAIERYKREKAEKEKAEERGIEGLPMFDKNVQEEQRTEQLRLFSLKPKGEPPTDKEFELMRQAAKGPQPDSKDLIAMHNTTAEGILFMDELGGLPAPSLGIANFRYPLTSYGDVSLIFNKSSIDPTIAKVFDSDIYSPRTPEVLWQSDMKAYRDFEKKVREKIHDITKQYGRYMDAEDEAKRGNKERFIQKLMNDPDFIAWATMESGQEIPWKSFIKTPDLETPLSNTKAMKDFLAANPEFMEKPDDQYTKQDEEIWKQALLASADEYAQKNVKGKLTDEEKRDVIDVTKMAELRKFFTDFKDFEPIMRRTYIFLNDMRKLKGGKVHNYYDYSKWTRKQADLMKPTGALQRIAEAEANKIFGEKYIESGQQDLPVTLENLVEVMLSSGIRGVEKGMTFGPGKARAVGAKQLKTMDRIQQEKARIVSDEEMEKARKDLEAKTEEVQKTARLSYGAGDLSAFGGTWQFLDDFHKAMADYFKGGKNATSMERALWKNGWKDPPTYLVEEMVELAEHLRNMPTEYFEAKLERAVDPSEIKVAIIPKGTDPKAIAVLEKYGIPHFQYNPRRDRDRENWVKKATQALELRFSLAPEASTGIEQDFNVPEPPGLPADPEHPERWKWEHDKLIPMAQSVLDQQGYYHAKDGSWLISRPNRSEKELLARGRGWRRTTFTDQGKPSGHDYMETGEALDYVIEDLKKPGPAFSLDPSQLWALPKYQEHNLSTAGATTPEEAKDAAATWKAQGPKSPWFKRWFGDWEKDKKNASKILDDKGLPRVVYHGTVSPEDFEVFGVGNPGALDEDEGYIRTGSGADPTAYLGSHFAFEPSVANEFANGLYGERVGAEGGKVYPVYLNIRNPKAYDDERKLANEIFECEIDIEQYGYLDPTDEGNYGKDKETTRKVNKRAISEAHQWEDSGQSLGIELADAFKKKLLAEGYDGIIYQNAGEGGTSVIAFEPNQIKSSIGNLGTFRPDKDNIQFALANTENFDVPEYPGGPLPADFFYSNAENAVKGISMNKAPAVQWWNMLKPEGGRGTKKEELDWLGLEGWLKDHGDRPVMKQEILDYIDENKITIMQRPLLGEGLTPQDEKIIKKIADRRHQEEIDDTITDMVENQGISEDQIDRTEISNQTDWGKIYDKTVDEFSETLMPEYYEYNLGGPKDNYRETLYNLHFKKMLPEGYELKLLPGEGYGYKNKYALIEAATGKEIARGDKYALMSEARAKEGMALLYEPPHFTTATKEATVNAVGHTRTDIRILDDGEAILFGEEFQSDLQEQGHKLGYFRGIAPEKIKVRKIYQDKLAEIEEDIKSIGFDRILRYESSSSKDWGYIKLIYTGRDKDQHDTNISLYWGRKISELDDAARIRNLRDEINRNAFPYYALSDEALTTIKDMVEEYAINSVKFHRINIQKTEEEAAVIDVPYKSTWLRLLAKAFIEQAVQEGLRAAGFTTGQQQYDRWGSEIIGWKDNGDGTWKTYFSEQYRGNVAGIDLEGAARDKHILKFGDANVKDIAGVRNIFERTVERKRREYSAANWEKYLDKWAKTIWDKMQTEKEGQVLPRRQGFISAYDEQLVNEINLLLKPYGVKVEKRLMDVGKRDVVLVYEGPDVSLEMMKDIAEAEGDGPNTNYYNFVKKQMEHRGLSFREVMEAGTGQIGAAGTKLLKLVNGKMIDANLAPAEHIWYFDITREMAQAIRARGLPMFSLSGDEIGRMGSQPSKAKNWSPAEREDFYKQNAKLQKKFRAERMMKGIKEVAAGVKEVGEKALVSISMQLEGIHPDLKYRMRQFIRDKMQARNEARKLVLPFLKKKSKMAPEDKEKYDLAEKNIDEPTIEALNAKYDLGIEYKAKRLALERIYDEAQKAGFEDLGYIFRYAPRSPSDLEGFMEFMYGDEGSLLKQAVEDKVKDRFAAIDKQIENANARYDTWLKEVQEKGAIEINELRAKYMEAIAETGKAEAQKTIAGIEPGIREKAKAREAELADRIHIKEKQLSARIEEINNEKGTRLQDLQSKKRPLTKEETFKIANNLLRGYQIGKTKIPDPGFTKARAVELISPELNKYYDHSDIALLKYIDGMTEAIEIRKLFGKFAVLKDKQLDIPQSVGQIAADLVEQGIVKQEQEEKLRYLLNAYFAPAKMFKPLALYRSLEYIETLGNIFSAMTQITDQAWAVGNAGWINWITALLKKNRINVLEDYGIENIAHEFAEASKTTRALELALKYGGLSIMDRLGKNALINATLYRYEKEAADPKRRELLIGELTKIFGKERAPLVMDDLRRQELTKEVYFLLFNTLFDFQPVDPLELPPGYSTGGKSRVLYMLKTYTLKQWERYAAQLMKALKSKSKAERKEGVRLLIMFLGGLYALGCGVDILKDLTGGRKVRISDTMVDNIFKLFGFSKFQILQFRVEKPQWAVAKLIVPPFRFFESIWQDTKRTIDKIKKGEEIRPSKWSVWQSVPLIGKLYYWWIGGGVEKEEARIIKQDLGSKKKEGSIAGMAEKQEGTPEQMQIWRKYMGKTKDPEGAGIITQLQTTRAEYTRMAVEADEETNKSIERAKDNIDELIRQKKLDLVKEWEGAEPPSKIIEKMKEWIERARSFGAWPKRE